MYYSGFNYQRRENVSPIEKTQEVTQMPAMPTYKGTNALTNHTKRLWMTLMVILGITLAVASVLLSTEAQAASNSDRFPKTTLMKGQTQLQNGLFNYGTWHYYEAGRWNTIHADGLYSFPPADVVRAGTTLHIRINKPQRPESFIIKAYPRSPEFSDPTGEGQRLATTLRRVEHGGKTVGWDVFFRVSEDNRHYYLETHARWERVEGTHTSYGNMHENFHLRTAD